MRIYIAVKSVVILFAGAAVFSTAYGELLLPTGTGTTWKYQMIQEFGKGVGPRVDENVKLDADGKLRLPVSIVVAGKGTIDGVETIKYELRRQGRVQLTEFLKVDENGVTALARSAEDGEKSELAPPQKILSFPPRAREKWNYSGRVGEIETTQTYEIVARESVEVPAGKFDAFHLRLTQMSPAPPNVVEERWFVPNLGYVKILTTMTRADGGLLERIDLQLSERPAIGQLPPAVAASTAEKKLLHASLAKETLGEPTGRFAADTERIFCRWQGDALHEGDKIRAVWIAEDVGDVAPKNYKVSETSTSADGPQAVGTFTLSRPTKGWPIGKYRLEIYDGIQIAETIQFSITATNVTPTTANKSTAASRGEPKASGAETKAPLIIEIVIASSIDDQGEIVNPRFTFSPNEPQITAIVYVGKTGGGQLKVTWYKVSEDEEGKPFDEKLFEHLIPVKSNERAFSVAKNPGGTLEVGRYKVVATLEGQTEETEFDVSPPKRPIKTSNRPNEELFETQAKDINRLFLPGTNFDGLRAVSEYEWSSDSEPKMQKVAWSPSSLTTCSNSTASSGAQQGKRPVAGASGTAPQPSNVPSGPAPGGCRLVILNRDVATHAYLVPVSTEALCALPDVVIEVDAAVAGSPQVTLGTYTASTRQLIVNTHIFDPCSNDGSDLPGTKINLRATANLPSQLTAPITSTYKVITLGADTLAPGVILSSAPTRGSFVKADEKITLWINAQEFYGGPWQTGVRRIWLEANPEGRFDKKEWTNPSRLPKPCNQKTWEQDFDEVTYTVPKDPPPIIEICAYADDYADNQNSKCADYATGEWRGTLREHAQGSIYNETVTVIFSFNEERDGTIKGAGRAKLESDPQKWRDCTSTRKLITPEPLLFPFSGKRVGDEFHLELPTDYRLRLRTKTDCPESSSTVAATRSLGMSETFYHPKVKAKDGATNSFHKPGAMDVSGTIEIHRAKQ